MVVLEFLIFFQKLNSVLLLLSAFNSFYTKIFVIRNCALICVTLMDSIKALSGGAERTEWQKWWHQWNWYVNSQPADLVTRHTSIVIILFPNSGRIVLINIRKHLHKNDSYKQAQVWSSIGKSHSKCDPICSSVFQFGAENSTENKAFIQSLTSGIWADIPR